MGLLQVKQRITLLSKGWNSGKMLLGAEIGARELNPQGNHLWKEGLEKRIHQNLVDKQPLHILQILVKMWEKRHRIPQKRDHPSSILHNQEVVPTAPPVKLYVAGSDVLGISQCCHQ